jgi:hypothetical protein
MTPEEIVKQQVIAYNARDIEAFARCHHKDVELYRLGESTPFVQGRDALYARYKTIFDESPDLHTDVVQRMVLGNTVIDKEVIVGRSGVDTSHFIAIYQVEESMIHRVHFVSQ